MKARSHNTKSLSISLMALFVFAMSGSLTLRVEAQETSGTTIRLCYCHNICNDAEDELNGSQCTSVEGQQNGHQKSVDCNECLEGLSLSCDPDKDESSCFDDPDGDGPLDAPCANKVEDIFGKCNGCGDGELASLPDCCDPDLEDCSNEPDNLCEECDDGNNQDGDGCDENCQLEDCGDGNVDEGETCDDGGICDDNGADCTTLDISNCTDMEFAECIPQDGDGCDNNCQEEICGDGFVSSGEDCDDGQQCEDGETPCESEKDCVEIGQGTCAPRNGDGCDENCQDECGNGRNDPNEACDPTAGDQCCNEDCTLNTGDECDDGDACTEGETCLRGQCGDGSDTDCDDGIACTDESCDSELGCDSTPNDENCADDGNECTVERCDEFDGCVADNNDAFVQDCYTGPEGTEGVGECVGGTESCEAGELTECIGEVTPAQEICNDGLDNDCDGFTDQEDEDDCIRPAGFRGDGKGDSFNGLSCSLTPNPTSSVSIALVTLGLFFLPLLSLGWMRKRLMSMSIRNQQ